MGGVPIIRTNSLGGVHCGVPLFMETTILEWAMTNNVGTPISVGEVTVRPIVLDLGLGFRVSPTLKHQRQCKSPGLRDSGLRVRALA